MEHNTPMEQNSNEFLLLKQQLLLLHWRFSDFDTRFSGLERQ